MKAKDLKQKSEKEGQMKMGEGILVPFLML